MNADFMKFFPEYLRKCFLQVHIKPKTINEIRIRINRPVIVNVNNTEVYINETGLVFDAAKGYCMQQREFHKMMECMCNYSLYAYEEELKQGYLTIEGGHRAGVCGSMIVKDNKVYGIRNITCMNLRISNEWKGCADELVGHLRKQGLMNVLIISAPGKGKTTLLRDLIRQISDDTKHFPGISISLIDERGEIASCLQGIPQKDVGIRTDVYDGCPKTEGMMMAVRSMGPGLLAIDEIGGEDDIRALSYAGRCGCYVFATVHGEDLAELEQKPWIGMLLKQNFFQEKILITGKGRYHCL